MRASALALALAINAALPTMASDSATVRQEPQAPNQNQLFNRLLEEAKGIAPLLHTVTDKASAEKAAEALAARTERMRILLKQLEEMPPVSDSAQTGSTQMATLTYVMQGAMPTIQRLIEVNAYGSDKLLDILRRYLSSHPNIAEDSPEVRLYEELGDNLGDILYVLRKTQDPASAKTAASSLREALSEHRRLGNLIGALVPVPGSAQQDDLDAMRERLSHLREELKQEYGRLKEAEFYFDPDLAKLLKECIDSAD